MRYPLVSYFVWRRPGAGDVCLLYQDEEGPESLYLVGSCMAYSCLLAK